MSDRQYLPTLAELIDRLSIVLMKSIFIPENRDAYRDEIRLIKHDINDEICNRYLKPDWTPPNADLIYAILITMLANRFIWENEAQARDDGGGVEQLRITHSINGVRNNAKNVIAEHFGERKDLKIDCLAADLPKEYGNWDVF
jgi:hypothetical protein